MAFLSTKLADLCCISAAAAPAFNWPDDTKISEAIDTLVQNGSLDVEFADVAKARMSDNFIATCKRWRELHSLVKDFPNTFIYLLNQLLGIKDEKPGVLAPSLCLPPFRISPALCATFLVPQNSVANFAPPCIAD